jgi:rhodanese-related sulfurtransferase
LQVNFNFSGSQADYEAASLSGAAFIASVPGLAWKIWPMNEAAQEAGGIYLFDDDASAQGFARQLEPMLRDNPSLSNVSIRQFDILEGLTAITRGALAQAVPAPRTFNEMAAEALAVVPTIAPAAAQLRRQENPDLLVIDVRDAADVAATGTIPGAVNISFGALTYQADHEVPETWRAPQLADRSRPIITTCILGPLGAMGGKLLHDMGYTDVQILAGGVQAWIDAGLPVTQNGGG